LAEVGRLQPKAVQKVPQHISYEFLWIRKTRDYIILVECSR